MRRNLPAKLGADTASSTGNQHSLPVNKLKNLLKVHGNGISPEKIFNRYSSHGGSRNLARH